MNIAFRCEHCGKLLSARVAGSGMVRCEACGKLTSVPTALAALPRPRLPGAASEGIAVPPGLNGGSGLHAGEVTPKEPAAVGTLERAMPAIISLCFHMALVLMTLFLGTVMMSGKPQADATPIVVPEMRGDVAVGQQDTQALQFQEKDSSTGDASGGALSHKKVTEQNAKMVLRGLSGGDEKAGPGLPVIGPINSPSSGGDSNGKGLRLGIRPNTAGDRNSIFVDSFSRRTTHAPRHIVFVVDRSGSMMNSFDAVRAELISTIGRLDPERQDFHVILFSDGEPKEPADRRLVPPTGDYLTRVVDFIMKTPASGSTDPLPAISQAFDVLDKASGTKAIFLLTDSQFPQPQKLLELLRQRNAKKEVVIFPILYGERSPDAEETMQKIAKENGGTKYRYVQPEE